MENEKLAELDVSIIIVSWNTRQVTCDCLRSVYEQTKGVSFEVILVDNASSDDSVEMIKKEFPQVVLIENSENRGFAAANNQGMEIACGGYVLLLNSDTVVMDHAVEKTVAFADHHPEAGVVGCRAIWPDGRRQNTCFRFVSLYHIFLASLFPFRMWKLFHISFFHPERYLDRDFSQDLDVDVVAGCFFMVRRNVIEQVGMFDEDFFMYGEEAEWCYRIKEAGWKIKYFAGADIIHIYGASSKKVSVKMDQAKRRAQLVLLYKTKGWAYSWLANLLMFLGMVPRLPFWLGRDVVNLILRKTLADALLDRFRLICFHVKGLMMPVWAKDRKE